MLNPQGGKRICLKEIFVWLILPGSIEKACLKGLFLMVTASGSNSTMMALNGPNFSLDSLDDDLFRIG